MTDNILTPFSLWDDFDCSLPLKESKINVVSLGMIDYNYVYFSGRQTNDGRVRIYALYAQQKTESKGSVLILPDVTTGGIDEDIVLHFVKNGYNVLYVDLCGERENSKNFTKYPSDVAYANFNQSGRTFYFADKTAKETCWYEWASVARYAISFLVENNPNKPIVALGIKYGADVLWQAAAMDKRLSAAIFLFGAGWLAYKDVDKRSDTELEMNDERFRFLAAVDAQAYAQYVECPVMFIGATNNAEFNPERAVDTLSRISNQKNANYLFIPSAIDALDVDCLNNVDIFIKKYAEDGVDLPEQPQLGIDFNDAVISFNAEYDKSLEIEEVKILASFNDDDNATRVWRNILPSNKNKRGDYVYALNLKNDANSVLAFVTVKYKNGFTVSSKLVYKKIDFKSENKLPNILYNADNYPIEFLATEIKTPLMCNVFSTEKFYNVINGPYDIKGLSTVNAITTYSIRKFAYAFTQNSFLKFDVYARDFVTLTVVINDGERDYFYDVNVTGGDTWQNVSAELIEFKDADGFTVNDLSKIISVTFKSIGVYAINNILVL